MASGVSVIVPCYNYGAFLPRCVESVLTQDGIDVRLLIIDDASSDATPEIGARLAAQDKRVEFRRHHVNQGHIATYNEGLRWASEDYTILLSSDDLLTPGALQRAAQVMDEFPSVGLVYGPFIKFSTAEQLPVPTVALEPEWEILDGLDWFKRLCRKAENPIAVATVVVRTSLQHRLGGYRENLPHAGDLEMWLRFALHADLARIKNTDQGYFRVHDESMQHTRFRSPVAQLEQRKAAFDVIFREHGSRIPDPGPLQRVVNRALAGDALWFICQAAYRRKLAMMPVGEVVDFAARTYRGVEERPTARGSRLHRVRQLPYLVSPFLDGARRWLRGWLKPRVRALRSP